MRGSEPSDKVPPLERGSPSALAELEDAEEPRKAEVALWEEREVEIDEENPWAMMASVLMEVPEVEVKEPTEGEVEGGSQVGSQKPEEDKLSVKSKTPTVKSWDSEKNGINPKNRYANFNKK